MARIEYCDDEEIVDGWHPIYEDACGDSRLRDDWFSRYTDPYRANVARFRYEFLLDVASENVEEREFQRLASRWKRETALYSNLAKIVAHEDYQRIMAMGPSVIPYMLRDLSQKVNHWFWALHNLVPEGQDPAEGLTTMEEARQAWLRWGLENDKL
jgi:hypothetical protein